MADNTYDYFLASRTSKQWQKFGIKRRAGVLAPLFSLYSADSCGIGEYPDIKLLADWCIKCGMSIIQLLPLNDTGYDFAPYSCQSTFALEPMYLRMADIKGIKVSTFDKEMQQVFGKCETGGKRVDYSIKKKKLKVLWKMFGSISSDAPEFKKFRKTNSFWLDDYAVYKVLKDKFDQRSWEDWEEKFKFKETGAIEEFVLSNEEEVNFHKWLQWQIYSQFSAVKEYANSKGVFIQGDLPFLVARDSADVWSHQNYFKLDVSSGAPPDMYFAKGQRWGMPTYNWERIEANSYDYLREKVKFAQNFYDMFRIDHFVGLFRLWTIKLGEPSDTYGLNGVFDPEIEDSWKEHGRKILEAMTENTDMLPCAEDLGVVPGCSYETLKEFAIPGMDVQRWTRDWGNTYDFKAPEKYRENSIAIISSHDMSPLKVWWEEEASTVDALLVEKICKENDYSLEQVHYHLFDMKRSTKARLRWHLDVLTPDEALRRLGKARSEAWMFYDMHRESYDEKEKFWSYIGLTGKPSDTATKEFISAAIKKVSSTRSVFSIHLIQDLMSLGNYFDKWDKWDMRVNTPGSISNNNWSIIMPVPLEAMLKMSINADIASINNGSNRV
jgi:4-alpha-glucanotransferase